MLNQSFISALVRACLLLPKKSQAVKRFEEDYEPSKLFLNSPLTSLPSRIRPTT